MTPDEKIQFEKLLKIVEENNEILKGIRRSNRFSLLIKSIYWFVIIGLSIGAFYFVQPYVNFMGNALGIDTNKSSDSQNTQSSSSDSIKLLQDLLK